MLTLLFISALNIAVSIAPIKGIIEDIGGNHFSYEVIYPPAANPHMYEPKPRDILKVREAKLFVYAGRAEPGGKKLCKMAKKCICLEDLLGVSKNVDPHVWLTPEFVKEVADSIAGILSELEPELQDTFRENARKLAFFVDSIIRKAKTTGKSVLLMHGAFKPFFEELGFDVLLVSKEPGIEPGARRLKELSDKLKHKNVSLGVCEKGRPCDAVKILSKRYGFKVIMLDPLYDESFTTFLKEAVLTIKNATNSGN